MFQVGDIVHPKKRELSQYVGTIIGSTTNEKGKKVWKILFNDGVDRGAFSGQQIILHQGTSTMPSQSEGGNCARGNEEWTGQRDMACTTIVQEVSLTQEQIDAAATMVNPEPPPESYKQFCIGTRVKLKSQKYGANSFASIMLSVAKHQWLLKFDDGREPGLYKSQQLVFLSREDDPKYNVSCSQSGSRGNGTEPRTSGDNEDDDHDKSNSNDDELSASTSFDDNTSQNISHNDVLDDANEQDSSSSVCDDNWPHDIDEDDDDDDSDDCYYSDDEDDGYVEESLPEEEADSQVLRSRLAEVLRVDADETEDLINEAPDDDNRVDDPADYGFDPAATEETRNFRESQYQSAKENEIGKIIRVKWSVAGQTTVNWKVVSDSRPDNFLREFEQVGLIDFDPNTFSIAEIFFRLWPGDWKVNHQNLVYWIGQFNSSATRRVRLPTQREFIQMIACIITASGYEERGESLWKSKHQEYPSIFSGSSQAMERIGLSFDRFKQLKKYFSYAFVPAGFDINQSDPWWRIRDAIKCFNLARATWVAASRKKTLDENMSHMNPQTTKTGGLPHISFIKRKPRPLGTELKSSACAAVGMLLCLEIQEGKIPMQQLGPHWLSSTAACTHRLMKLSENCGQQGREKPNLFLGDAWFGTLSCICNIKKQGHDGILAIKNGSGGIPKKHFENLMKSFPAGSYMVCEAEITYEGQRMTIIYVAYKYNNKKVLHFVQTKNAGSTVPDPNRPYHARFKDPNGNMSRRDIPRPAVLSDYFQSSPAIDVHNQMRQGSLALEEAWVTQDPWFRINTTLIGMTVVDTKLGIQYHVGEKHPLANLTTVQFAGVIVEAILAMPLSDEVRPAISTAICIPDTICVGEQGPMSLITTDTALSGITVTVPVGAPAIPEWYREQHKMCKFTDMNAATDPEQRRRIRKRCRLKGCTQKTYYFCSKCQTPFCKDDTKDRFCFYMHLCKCFETSGMQTPDSAFVTSYREWSNTNGDNNQ